MHRKQLDTHSTKVLMSSMNMEQSRHHGFLFYRFEPLGKHIEEKAGRHTDDFLVTGPEENVERFLKQARDKLNMQDAVRLYKTGDEGQIVGDEHSQAGNKALVARPPSSHSRNCHSTWNGKLQSQLHTGNHQRRSAGRR